MLVRLLRHKGAKKRSSKKKSDFSTNIAVRSARESGMTDILASLILTSVSWRPRPLFPSFIKIRESV